MTVLAAFENKQIFSPDCQLCPRLVAFLHEVKQTHPDYYARPVPPFGDPDARLLIVGLAPGMHGANASGRPFTGDFAGLMLYETLYEFGYSNQPTAVAVNDGLVLKHCRITNAVKCLPPANKPLTTEVRQCNAYLRAELAALPTPSIMLSLGAIAHSAVLTARGYPLRSAPFKHNAQYRLPDGTYLVASYHTSRYNVQTKKLTQQQFRDVFQTIADLRAQCLPAQ